MINHGITSFLYMKKVKEKEGIKAFLTHQQVNVGINRHNEVNDYIQSNWSKFASFIDNSIKNGTLKGKAVKLNTHFDEERQRVNQIIAEKKAAKLTAQEDRILRKISKNGIGILKGYHAGGLKKDYSFTSKNMQWLPVIRKAIELGFKLEENG